MSIRATPGKAYLETFDWEQKVRTNPLFGVMSVEDFATAGADPTPEQLQRFFAEGTAKARRLDHALAARHWYCAD